jgi:virulence factor Mce-like protein
MNKFIRPLAYLTAFLAIAGIAGIAIARNDDGKKDTYQVTAYFEKAIGLFPNSDVDILGVPVGKVQTVEPVGDRVKVVMNVDRQYKVPSDATAQIVPISVISDRYVELAPAYQGGPKLEDGAVLDVDRTQIPAELDDVFKQLKKLLEAIEPGEAGEPGALGDLIVELNETLRDRESDLQGTLINAARLTRTLAGAEEDVTGILINIDDLFQQLSTRAGKFGTLNRNLALVLATLVESRTDLEGTIKNLGDLSTEVASLVQDHHRTLAEDLKIAVKITKTVLKNQDTVEQSLEWLPVVAQAASQAYHGGAIDSVDVRDNSNAKLECEILDTIPDLLDPVKDLLKEICKEETGEPDSGPGEEDVDLPVPTEPLPEIEVDPRKVKIDCSEGVRRVKKQLRRVRTLGLPVDVKDELLEPLEKRLRRLARECKKLGEQIKDPDKIIEDILDKLPDVGDLPDIEDPPVDVDDLFGSAAAAGSAPAPAPAAQEEEDEGFGDKIGGFFGGILSLVGVDR